MILLWGIYKIGEGTTDRETAAFGIRFQTTCGRELEVKRRKESAVKVPNHSIWWHPFDDFI